MGVIESLVICAMHVLFHCGTYILPFGNDIGTGSACLPIHFNWLNSSIYHCPTLMTFIIFFSNYCCWSASPSVDFSLMLIFVENWCLLDYSQNMVYYNHILTMLLFYHYLLTFEVRFLISPTEVSTNLNICTARTKICLGATKDNLVSFLSGHLILSSLVPAAQHQLQLQCDESHIGIWTSLWNLSIPKCLYDWMDADHHGSHCNSSYRRYDLIIHKVTDYWQNNIVILCKYYVYPKQSTSFTSWFFSLGLRVSVLYHWSETGSSGESVIFLWAFPDRRVQILLGVVYTAQLVIAIVSQNLFTLLVFMYTRYL